MPRGEWRSSGGVVPAPAWYGIVLWSGAVLSVENTEVVVARSQMLGCLTKTEEVWAAAQQADQYVAMATHNSG